MEPQQGGGNSLGLIGNYGDSDESDGEDYSTTGESSTKYNCGFGLNKVCFI